VAFHASTAASRGCNWDVQPPVPLYLLKLQGVLFVHYDRLLRLRSLLMLQLYSAQSCLLCYLMLSCATHSGGHSGSASLLALVSVVAAANGTHFVAVAVVRVWTCALGADTRCILPPNFTVTLIVVWGVYVACQNSRQWAMLFDGVTRQLNHVVIIPYITLCYTTFTLC
jgi:hypothetical protein